MRQPLRLLRQLGPSRFLALQVLFASMLLSPFVHPFSIAMVMYAGFVPGVMLSWLFWFGLAIFAMGYAVSIAVALCAARRSEHKGLVWSVGWLPIYWLLISVAAYAAVYERVFQQFRWNKTPHVGRRPVATSPTGMSSGRPAQEIADQL